MITSARKSTSKIFAMMLATALTFAIAGCSTSRDQQRAEQAEAAAAQAQASAARAEDAANKATEAANRATVAAEHATKVVEEATREINRVADHLEQLEKERDSRNHSRGASHPSAEKAAAPDDSAPSAK